MAPPDLTSVRHASQALHPVCSTSLIWREVKKELQEAVACGPT